MTTSPVQANAMASAITNPMANAQTTPTQSADTASASTSTVRESISSLAKEADDEADSLAVSNPQDASETVSAAETDSTATAPNAESPSETVETQLELSDAVDAATTLDADVKADSAEDVAMTAINEASAGSASSSEVASGETATASSATAKADTASLTSRLMPRFDPQNEGNAKAEDAPRKTFIPAAPTAMPDEASVPKAAETPAPRPTSIIKQISELWSSKPGTTDSQKRSEPNVSAKDTTEDKISSVLDLPQSAVVKPATDPAPTAQLEQPDDELDIPAFLRRQVN